MILKLLVCYIRWVWGLPPLVLQEGSETAFALLVFGVFIDISALIAVCVPVGARIIEWRSGRG